MNKVFVDSDIIIDLFADRGSFANPAAVLFDLNAKGKVKIFISAMSICNIYYVLRQQIGHAKATSAIELLVSITEILSTTKGQILAALKSDFKDFEDAVQHSSAIETEGVSAILTRNLKDYKTSRIAVFTAENYLKLNS